MKSFVNGIRIWHAAIPNTNTPFWAMENHAKKRAGLRVGWHFAEAVLSFQFAILRTVISTTVLAMRGRVMCSVCCQRFAPSIFADSYRVGSMLVRAAR